MPRRPSRARDYEPYEQYLREESGYEHMMAPQRAYVRPPVPRYDPNVPAYGRRADYVYVPNPGRPETGSLRPYRDDYNYSEYYDDDGYEYDEDYIDQPEEPDIPRDWVRRAFEGDPPRGRYERETYDSATELGWGKDIPDWIDSKIGQGTVREDLNKIRDVVTGPDVDISGDIYKLLKDEIIKDRPEPAYNAEDPEGKWLRDKKTGKFLYYKEKGDPNDPNYFWNPYNRETLKHVDNNWLQNAKYNIAGLRDDVYVGHDSVGLSPSVRVDMLSDPRFKGSSKNGGVTDFGPSSSAGSLGTHATNIERPKHVQAGSTPGSVIFTGSDYIQDIVCLNNQFSLQQFFCNPGLLTFPTLSQVAGAFVYYKFKKLIFRYVTLSNDSYANAGTSVAQGIVCMAVNDNVCSVPPTNLPNLANWPGAKTFKPSLSVKMEIDCSKQVAQYYFVRTNNSFQPYPQDPTTVTNTWGLAGQPTYPGSPQLTDYVGFIVATSGAPASYTMGELHVDFTVELCSPILYGSLNGGQCLYYRAMIGSPYGTDSVGGFVDPLVQGSGNLACTLDTAGGSLPLRIQFPPQINTGCYHIRMTSPISTLGVNWSSINVQTPSLVLPVVNASYTLLSPFANNVNGATNPIQDVGYSWSVSPINYEPAGGGSNLYMSNMYDSTNNTWVSCMILDFYIKVNKATCIIAWPSFTGDIPGIFYEGSIAINQVHPNFQYSWSSGQVSSNP